MGFLAYKKLAQFAVRCALPPRRSESPNPLACCFCWTGLLGRAVFPPWNEGPNFGSYRYFKQFLQSFSIKHIIGVPYNPQTRDIVEQIHHTLKLQIKKLKKGEYTGTLLSSLSKADFTRFQHKIFSKLIIIVNTALFVLNFLNLP